MRVDCQNLQELQEHVADLSHGDRIVLLTDKGAFRFRFNNNGIDFHESDEKGNLLMSETKDLCPDCGHLAKNHQMCTTDYCSCTRTYESLVGESSISPELQLLVIDMGDSCVVKVEKGHWDSGTLVCRGGREDTVKVFYECFRVLREAIDGEKPVPRIEQHPQIEERYYLHYFGDGNGCMPLTAQQYDDLTKINGGAPLKVYESAGKWEELIGLQKEGEVGWIGARILTIWRYKR